MTTFTTMEAGFAYLLTGAHEQELAAARRRRREAAAAAETAAQSLPQQSSHHQHTDLWPATSEWTGGAALTPTVSSHSNTADSPGLSKQLFRGDSVTSGMDLFIPPPVDMHAMRAFAQAGQLGLEAKEREMAKDIIEVPASPYEMRHGKRYLRDVPYLLPCDLSEIHRQSMRTMLGTTVFGKPVCAPVMERPPKRVLEIGCGSAFWTSTTHDYFKAHGQEKISFTGFDMAPLAPDLREQGIDWTFVLHNGRNYPWPFPAESFDYIMVKDLSLAIPFTNSQRFLEECIRILQPGGHLEVWESDHVLRCLSPHNRTAPAGTDAQDEATADATRTFLITPGMPFVSAQNKFIQDSNSWIEMACDKRKLPSLPCARVAETLFQEPDLLCDVGSRRVAIPLTELPWEKERSGSVSTSSGRKASRSGSSGKTSGKTKSKTSGGLLTPEQAAIRHTALMTVMQKIESLEPVLQEFSGKNVEEWATWWANMMADLVEGDGVKSGECLEMGAWWARKRMKT
ncbi:hypothetical protein BDZ85DRAFT_267740 [Elsinoe ampelina]|uniref:Methyltransferase domain-containing protein n=1 Tax=Elsinoe ampelina TaxID=302913 RepID=A0A6A6G297_9PEZI|nr:hypothetical protein BDZ85DRAFT_267740 [Elsinoe ampelina]